MSFFVFDLESKQEGASQRSRLIDVTSCMVMMTVSFVFCAVFVATVLSATSLPGIAALFAFIKAFMFVGLMILASALISSVFDAVLVRRVNAMVLGMVLAFALVLFNL